MNYEKSSEPDPVLDSAFPPERADIDHTNPIYGRAIDRILTDTIPTPTGSSMESLEQQIRQRRELFGDRYIHEYGSPAVRQILRDSAKAHDKDIEERLRSKQTKRLK